MVENIEANEKYHISNRLLENMLKKEVIVSIILSIIYEAYHVEMDNSVSY